MTTKGLKLFVTLAVVLLVCGCSRKSGYHFPEGKTLVYVVYEQVAVPNDEGKEILSEPMAMLEVRLRVWSGYGGQQRITLSAHPPDGRSDIHQGKDLGKVDFTVGKYGIEEILTGTKLPTQIRYFVPTFPSRPKKGLEWEEDTIILYRRAGHNIKLKHRYEGVKKVDDKKCSFVSGNGSIQMHEEKDDPANGLYVTLDFDFDYAENYCIDFDKGYLVQTVMKRTRKRRISDRGTEDDYLNETDMTMSTVKLERIE